MRETVTKIVNSEERIAGRVRETMEYIHQLLADLTCCTESLPTWISHYTAMRVTGIKTDTTAPEL